MRRVARHLKERLSVDTWRVLQELENQFLRFTPSNVDQRYLASMDLLDSTVSTLSAFSGLLMENTTRGYGWRFLEIGRRLERALQSSELLGASLNTAPADIEPHLQVLLQISDSSITYRQRHPTILETSLVLGLLLADEINPRAIAFQLASLLHQITRLQEKDESSVTAVERPLATQALTSVRNASMTQLSKRDDSGQFVFLDAQLDEVKTTLWDISDALTAHYLSHLTPSRLTSPW